MILLHRRLLSVLDIMTLAGGGDSRNQGGATGIQWVQAMDAVNYPEGHRAASHPPCPHNDVYPVPDALSTGTVTLNVNFLIYLSTF